MTYCEHLQDRVTAAAERGDMEELDELLGLATSAHVMLERPSYGLLLLRVQRLIGEVQETAKVPRP